MSLIYKHANIPSNLNTVLRDDIHKKTCELKDRLLKLDIESLTISAYTKQYFNDYLRKLNYALQSGVFLLILALKNANKSPKHFAMVDNGGGIGILSLIAKAIGIRTVIYHDIYDISAKDARTIASALGYPADHYIVGETHELVEFINKNNIACDTVVSKNVIEHIYDLDEYFETIAKIDSPNLNLLFATTANNKNILTDLYTKNIHKKVEYGKYSGKWQKDRDSNKSYFDIRKNMISDLLRQPSNSKVVMTLSRLTRGLKKEDIEKKIEKYKLTGELPKGLMHPTNTCDPQTGNWAEHLVELNEYEALFKKNGFDFGVIPGFYNTQYKLKVLNLITPIINRLIKITGKKGVYLSPFIVLSGKRKSNN